MMGGQLVKLAANRNSAPSSHVAGGVALGIAVPAGWVLHDAALFLTAGRPTAALDVLEDSLLVLVAGAAFGWCSHWRRLAPAAVVLSGAACLFHLAIGWRLLETEVWAPRVVFAMVVVFALTNRLGRRLGRWPGRWRVGLFLGMASCVAVVRLRGLEDGVVWSVVAPALVAVPVGLLRRGPRWTATILLVLAPALWLGRTALPRTQPARPDLGPPTVAARPGVPSLLLVVLDTVRADHLATYGYERVTTPGLDRWVRERFTRYEGARSTSPWTLPSHVSLFTGLLSSEHGTVHRHPRGRPIPFDTPTLSELLRAEGYRTAAIVANTGYLSAGRYGLERGFERYDDRPAAIVGDYLSLSQFLGGSIRLGHLGYPDARSITDRAIEWLAAHPDPFFLVLNYMEAHAPRFPPSPHDRAFSDEQPFDPMDPEEELEPLLYDRELRYLDEHLTRLLDAMEERGRLDDAVVIITSDHGEGLGDHGFPGHGNTLYEAAVQVPLFVMPAGGRTTEVVEDDVTGADVFHLALGLLGLETTQRSQGLEVVSEIYVHRDETVGHGASLSPAGEGWKLLAWKEGPTKMIASNAGQLEAYDLRSDPRELAPLPLSPGRVEEALNRARSWWDAHPVEGTNAAPVDPEQLKRLRALGYL
jgi:arylsulfatase A-like enzyme